MADVSDVETALVAQIAAVLFPSGGYQAGALTSSTLGFNVRAYRGWPVSAQLDADLSAGASHVSVLPQQNSARNTTRYNFEWTQSSSPTPTLTAVVSGMTVTLGGTPGTNQVVGILVQNVGYAYRPTGVDTLATIASSLAAAIAGSSANGATLTLPSDLISAQIAIDTTVTMEVARQEQVFRVSLWASTPAQRDLLAGLLHPALAGTRRLSLATGEVTEAIRPLGTFTDDMLQRADLWRRDITYKIEYPTTLFMTVPTVLFGCGLLILQAGTVVDFAIEQPVTEILTDGNGNILTDPSGELLGTP